MEDICCICHKNPGTKRKKSCAKCRRRQNSKARQKRRTDKGGCANYGCKNQRLPDKTKCQACLDRDVAYRTNRRQRLSDNGLCALCGLDPFLPCYEKRATKTRRCMKCYLDTTSRRHFGSKEYSLELLSILEKQDYKCVYTGEVLVLGVNDSLDHILPKKRYPDKATDISNLQWITRDINKMKSNLDEKKFIDLCRKVSNFSD